MTREENDENKDTISGLCPKVKEELQDEIKTDIQNEIEREKWWCERNENENPRKCNFPFKLQHNGKNYYKPVLTSDGEKKCIVSDNTLNMIPNAVNQIDWTNPYKEFTESQLVPCSPCPGK